jgi:hypothetical protein
MYFRGRLEQIQRETEGRIQRDRLQGLQRQNSERLPRETPEQRLQQVTSGDCEKQAYKRRQTNVEDLVCVS